MDTSSPPSVSRRVQGYALLLGVALFLLPWPVYWWARRSGELPARDEWQALGAAAGPWAEQGAGLLVWLSLTGLVVGFLALPVAGLLTALQTRELRHVAAGCALGAFYCALCAVNASALFWTIN